MRRRIGMLLLCVCLFGVFGCTEDPMENVEMDDYDGNFATQSTILQKGAETEQGIYWDYGGLILYMDKDSQAVTVLCSKPNCTHLNEDCDGRIGDTVSSLASLQEYAGKIYYCVRGFAASDDNYEVKEVLQLYRMEPDGTGRELVRECEIPLGSMLGGPNIILHRGRIYCLTSAEIGIGDPEDENFYVTTVYVLYAIDMAGDGEAREIWRSDGENMSMPGPLYAEGNTVYMRGYVGDDDNTETTVYACNIEEETIEPLPISVAHPVNGNRIQGHIWKYMRSGDGMYEYDLENLEERQILDLSSYQGEAQAASILNGVWIVGYTNSVLNSNNPPEDAGTQWIYTEEGKLAATLPALEIEDHLRAGWTDATDQYAIYCVYSYEGNYIEFYTVDLTDPTNAEWVQSAVIDLR